MENMILEQKSMNPRIHENTFKKLYFNGARGIVFLGDKMLVYRRDNKTNNNPGKIDFPGGGREGDESPFETFQREVKEEFGIDISKEEVDFSCTIPSVVEPSAKSYFIVAKVPSSKEDSIVFGNEGDEWLLMTPEEFINRPDGIERLQKRVEKYMAGTLMSE
ncbi:MAG: NUDIX domain-containing protein [archaeon]